MVKQSPSSMRNLEKLVEFFQAYPRVVVISGAGLSAGSGIPTYRDENGTWQRSEPIQHGQFISDSNCRQRYWARSFMGWPLVRNAQPNAAHRALQVLEQQDRVELLITQNVDRLHQRSGSQNVVDLHGRLDKVVCLDCNSSWDREHVQQLMAADNPHLLRIQAQWMPDGDADVSEENTAGFTPPPCESCSGTLMPDVVFFGGSVPRHKVELGMQAIARADALLVAGSSLQVFSGFRFCRHAASLEKPLALINPGVGRADHLASLKLAGDCADMLLRASEILGAKQVV